jgi:hypothetical protein
MRSLDVLSHISAVIQIIRCCRCLAYTTGQTQARGVLAFVITLCASCHLQFCSCTRL